MMVDLSFVPSDKETCMSVSLGMATVKRCYRYHSTPRDWEDARQMCDGSGGQLITIPTAEFIMTVAVALINKFG